MPKCTKCGKRTGVVINYLCATCHELWLFEKDRFKRLMGYNPEPDDYGQWIFEERKFNARLIKKEG